jgi:hypothetical protein
VAIAFASGPTASPRGPSGTPLIPSTMPSEQAESFGRQVPLSRAGQPAEVAPACVFLPPVRPAMCPAPGSRSPAESRSLQASARRALPVVWHTLRLGVAPVLQPSVWGIRSGPQGRSPSKARPAGVRRSPFDLRSLGRTGCVYGSAHSVSSPWRSELPSESCVASGHAYLYVAEIARVANLGMS